MSAKEISLLIPRGREKKMATTPPYSKRIFKEQFRACNSEEVFAETLKNPLFKLANHIEENGGALLDYCASGAPMITQLAGMTHANR